MPPIETAPKPVILENHAAQLVERNRSLSAGKEGCASSANHPRPFANVIVGSFHALQSGHAMPWPVVRQSQGSVAPHCHSPPPQEGTCYHTPRPGPAQRDHVPEPRAAGRRRRLRHPRLHGRRAVRHHSSAPSTPWPPVTPRLCSPPIWSAPTAHPGRLVPALQVASGAAILFLGARLSHRRWRQRAAANSDVHDHGHHDHSRSHGGGHHHHHPAVMPTTAAASPRWACPGESSPAPRR